MLTGLSCTKGVWYIYDWDTGSSILRTDLVKSCLQALPACSLVNSKGVESTLCKVPRPCARVLTLRHAPTSRQHEVRASRRLYAGDGSCSRDYWRAWRIRDCRCAGCSEKFVVGAGCVGGKKKEWMRCFLDELKSFRYQR